MKKTLLIIVCILFFTAAESFGRDEPLANEGKRGLYARSVKQVLGLKEEEIDLGTAALIISEQWSDMVHGRRYRATLNDMAFEIREMLTAKKVGMDYRAVAVINEYLFKKEEFESLSEVGDPNDLFLHRVLDAKRGYCLSLSILYLSLSERLGLPLYGVVVPGHFFVRYDDGQVRFNIETTSGGGTAPNEHYIKKFKVPAGKEDSIYLRNLSKIETLGCFFNNLGNSYSEIGDMESALRALETAVEINPSLAESRMNLGNIYLKKGWVKDAIDEYRRALRINPNDAKTHLNLGNAYSEQGWVTKAIAEYKRSLKLDSSIVDTHKNLAAAYCTQKMFRLALAQVKRALALEPEDISLYCRLGDVYRQMGNHEKAKSQYTKALKMNPNLAEAHYGMAMYYNKLGRVDEEIEAYEKALAIEPDMVSALVNLANAYVAKEEYDAAIELYERGVQIRPNDAMIRYNFGTAYTNKGDYEQAVAEYEKAVEIDPKMGDGHNGLAYGFYRLKKYDLAFRHIKIAEELGIEIDKKLLGAIEKKLR
ncbi:MAG: tetratricopeptide repeat protein [Planctomycetota bacterium]|jgi:tetratricopeptide (TPR) repeat protein